MKNMNDSTIDLYQWIDDLEKDQDKDLQNFNANNIDSILKKIDESQLDCAQKMELSERVRNELSRDRSIGGLRVRSRISPSRCPT